MIAPLDLWEAAHGPQRSRPCRFFHRWVRVWPLDNAPTYSRCARCSRCVPEQITPFLPREYPVTNDRRAGR